MLRPDPLTLRGPNTRASFLRLQSPKRTDTDTDSTILTSIRIDIQIGIDKFQCPFRTNRDTTAAIGTDFPMNLDHSLYGWREIL